MIRYAFRSMIKSPGFSAIAVIALGLGIGANTAIFSVVNAVLLRPLPYADPDRLVVARGSLPDFRDAAAQRNRFAATHGWAPNLYTLDGTGDGRQVRGAVLSPEILPMLGVTPLLGRSFTPDDN